uniref:Uncharacterized protein n=1 Tax=Pristionchus pacificus TaxID=54126 RepID=A0A2A6C5V2_PRIPA|eukprot:PDM73520.1 hypothetical protein PRIPAC_40876 [Pristionchus pacificus]
MSMLSRLTDEIICYVINIDDNMVSSELQWHINNQYFHIEGIDTTYVLVERETRLNRNKD